MLRLFTSRRLITSKPSSLWCTLTVGECRTAQSQTSGLITTVTHADVVSHWWGTILKLIDFYALINFLSFLPQSLSLSGPISSLSIGSVLFRLRSTSVKPRSVIHSAHQYPAPVLLHINMVHMMSEECECKHILLSCTHLVLVRSHEQINKTCDHLFISSNYS